MLCEFVRLGFYSSMYSPGRRYNRHLPHQTHGGGEWMMWMSTPSEKFTNKGKCWSQSLTPPGPARVPWGESYRLISDWRAPPWHSQSVHSLAGGSPLSLQCIVRSHCPPLSLCLFYDSSWDDSHCLMLTPLRSQLCRCCCCCCCAPGRHTNGIRDRGARCYIKQPHPLPPSRCARLNHSTQRPLGCAGHIRTSGKWTPSP